MSVMEHVTRELVEECARTCVNARRYARAGDVNRYGAMRVEITRLLRVTEDALHGWIDNRIEELATEALLADSRETDA